MSRGNVEKRLTFAASFSVLQHATGRDSAATLQINQHPVLSTTGNRRRNHTNRDTIDLQKLVVLILKILWHLIVCSVNPAITHRRAEVGPDEVVSGLLVVHAFVVARDHIAVNGRAAITVSHITKNFLFPLAITMPEVRLARLLHYIKPLLCCQWGVV